MICIPENYNSANAPTDFKLRITHPANFSYWSSLSKQEYKNEKEKYEDLIFQNGLRYLKNVQESKDEMANRVLFVIPLLPKQSNALPIMKMGLSMVLQPNQEMVPQN